MHKKRKGPPILASQRTKEKTSYINNKGILLIGYQGRPLDGKASMNPDTLVKYYRKAHGR